jgi:hypothetical protein
MRWAIDEHPPPITGGLVHKRLLPRPGANLEPFHELVVLFG